MIFDLDLDLLRAFVAVAEAGSFTAAANVVGRSQSAVSQKILRLEDNLQLRVFERTSRSLTLTKDGERLLVTGRRMLGQYDAFIRELRDPPAVRKLRLGISENLVHTQLPQFLAQISVLFPDLQVDLATGGSAELLADYEEGHLDLVIAKRKEGTTHGGRVIWREPLVWIAAANYCSDTRRPARLVMMKAPCVYRDVMTEALDSVHREWITACTANNLIGVQAALHGGLGVTVLGKSFVQSGLKTLPPADGWPTLPTTEVAVIGERSELRHLTEPLIADLSQALMESGSLVLDAAAE